MTFWFYLLGTPLFLYGFAAVLKPQATAGCVMKFPRWKAAGVVLAVAAWFFTAYELDTIGIEVFDRYLKAFPGELWILAGVLSTLTVMWMSNLLPIRAACALLMLYPAEMLPTLRLCETPLRISLSLFAYVCIITGMFGMFYPWRIRQFMAWRTEKDSRTRFDGGVMLGIGILFLTCGTLSLLGIIK